MAFNDQVHPRNPYKDKPPDFKNLASKFADFRQHCRMGANGKVHVNFRSDAAVRSLARTLLKADFNLDVRLPEGSLVPRITQRLNYLLIIEDYLLHNRIADHKQIIGIDIGTGASCVYPLLGCRHLGWRFIATDVDADSVRVARENVERNGLAEQILVTKVDGDTILKDVVSLVGDATAITFCMCNPPFFESEEAKQKFTEVTSKNGNRKCLANECDDETTEGRAAPKSSTIAKDNELAVEGGEVAFVNKIIDDSLFLKGTVKIYTSMVGKKSSLVALKKRLAKCTDAKHAVATLNQGNTQRWVLLWSFRDDIDLHVSPTNSAPVTIQCPAHAKDALLDANPLEWLVAQCNRLEMTVSRESRYSVLCEARRDTWTKQRQRNRAVLALHSSSKRARLAMEDIGIQVNLGAGDGRDSLADAGNFCAIDTKHENSQRHVSVQTYLPMEMIAPITQVLRFRAEFEPANRTLRLLLVEGSRVALNQIQQFCKNRIQEACS